MPRKLLACLLVVVTTIMPMINGHFAPGLEKRRSGLAELVEAEAEEDLMTMQNANTLNGASKGVDPEVEKTTTAAAEVAPRKLAADEIEQKRDAFMTRADEIEKALEQLKRGYEEERSVARRAMEEERSAARRAMVHLRMENDKTREALRAILRRDKRNEMKRFIRSKNEETRSGLRADVEEMGEKFDKRQMKELGVPTFLDKLTEFVEHNYAMLVNHTEQISTLENRAGFTDKKISIMKKNLAAGDESLAANVKALEAKDKDLDEKDQSLEKTLAAKTDELRSKINNVESEQIRCETGWKETAATQEQGVTFSRPFSSTPSFLLAITGFDTVEIGHGIVAKIWYKSLSKTGVTLYNDCHNVPLALCAWGTIASWIACGI